MFIDFDTLDLDELQAIADSLPGPHAWAWSTADIFVCQACHISFQYGETLPEIPCDPLDPLPSGEVRLDGIALDEFIGRFGRAEAERRLGEFGLGLDPGYPPTDGSSGGDPDLSC